MHILGDYGMLTFCIYIYIYCVYSVDTDICVCPYIICVERVYADVAGVCVLTTIIIRQ